MKTIVISAVNLNRGGTLTILRDCLAYLSSLAEDGDYRIMALVYKKDLAYFPNIEYIETEWPKKLWINRLWYEYVSMKKISKEIGPVYLWFSLHDTTPNVLAEKRAVYCHNSFPFYKWKQREWLFAPKIVLFALFSKCIYRKNIHQNDFVVVQQQWMKDAFKNLFSLSKSRIVVALPDFGNGSEASELSTVYATSDAYKFIYPAVSDSHKNVECLCQAAEILEKQGIVNFKVQLTINGQENKYTAWLYKKWGKRVQPLNFIGYRNKSSLFELYSAADCLVFPSKVETWEIGRASCRERV